MNVNIDDFNQDPLAWSTELAGHFCGEFSMAAVQSNVKMEDKSQVEVCRYATFVGIYDGCKGDDASAYIDEHLFPTLLGHIKDNIDIDTTEVAEDILRQVVSEIEASFTEFAKEHYDPWGKKHMSVVSSGCLICIIWRGKLYLANVGDSRAVLVSHKGDDPFKRLRVKQMVRDHSCENSDIREELATLYPYDYDSICSYDFGAWRVKGLSETSRCIGNAYMKKAEFTTTRSVRAPPGEHVTSLFIEPLLSADPEIYTRVLKDTDKFIIFGSGGFWKLLTNEQAANIVNDNPREGIAARLAAHALQSAAEKKGKNYRDILQTPTGSGIGGRRNVSSEVARPVYHDDISVTVVYLELDLDVRVQSRSYKSYSNFTLPSDFSDFDDGTW